MKKYELKFTDMYDVEIITRLLYVLGVKGYVEEVRNLFGAKYYVRFKAEEATYNNIKFIMGF